MDSIVYFDGSYVKLAEANINILTHGLHYGMGVVEGIRGYWVPEEEELFLFRADTHYRRWKLYSRLLGIEPRKSPEELAEITCELIRMNQLRRDVYIRPIAYSSTPGFTMRPDGQAAFAIVVLPYDGHSDAGANLRAGVVSWQRVADAALPIRSGICGAYANSMLAINEARRHGYDEPILLNAAGHVAEGAASNLFMVRAGRLITPPASESIQEGLTRASVIELARRELHIEVVERPIDRSELYLAEEMFFAGTTLEVAPVTQVDGRPVGPGTVGFVTGHLSELYEQATHGRIIDYHAWLHGVYQPVLAGARR
jgi:branched-chain amino acid aminotransferase